MNIKSAWGLESNHGYERVLLTLFIESVVKFKELEF